MEAKVENGINSEKHFAFSKHNFHKICRLCFSNGKEVLYDLNLSTYEQETLQMVMDSFAIHSGPASSSFDCLPSNICINCIKHILQYRSFRDQLKQSNTMLKLVYDYLYNCSEPSNILDPNHKKKHRNKFITISYKEYPTIEDLLSRCRLVSNQIDHLGVIKTEEIHCIDDDDDVDFNLKVLQPVSDDVPSVIFNESDNYGYNNNELCGELLENVPINIFLQEQVNSDVGNRLSISVDNNDDESNLLERILQATNDQIKKSPKQSKAPPKRPSSKSNSKHAQSGVSRNRKRAKAGTPAQNGIKHHQVVHRQVHPHHQMHHQVILNHSQFQQQNLDRKDFIRLEEAEVIIKDEPDLSYDIEYDESSDLSLFSLLNTAPKAPKYVHHSNNGNRADTNHRRTSSKPRSNPKRWSCSKCDRLFVGFNAYTQHLETAHLHHFTCEICLKQFTCETTFQRHKRLHQRVY